MRPRDREKLVAFLAEHFTRTQFRLEGLRAYNVETEKPVIEQYLAGEPTRDMVSKMTWLEKFTDEARRGLHRQRLRVLRPPLGDYERFECEWGYVYNVPAGEDVRVLELAPDDTREVADLANSTEDFYLVDEEFLVPMYYDETGAPIGWDVITEPEAIERYRRIVAALVAEAVPFEPWWAAHPEYHRANQSA